jgi:hypothetical protein
MPSRVYEWRSIGHREAARGILEIAAANVQLAKSETVAYKASASARGPGAQAGQKDAHVRARALALKEQQRSEAQAQKASVRAAEQAVKAKERIETQARKKAERDDERSVQRRVTYERRQREQHFRNVSKAEEKARKDMLKRRMDAVQAEGRLFTGAVAVAGGVAGMAIGAGAALGSVGYDIGSAATRQKLLNEKRARALAVGGGDRGAVDVLLADAERSALAVRGTRAEDVLAGQQRFTAMTGDLATARKLGGTMATAARASGASEEDIAATMATFSTKFGIKDKAGMQSAIAAMVQGGKSGAFELSDASRYFQEMGAAGSRFGLDQGAAGVQKLGAMAQIARMSTGSGAEASTGVQAMLRQLVAKSDDIKKMNAGKEVVFSDKGKTRTNDVVDVLVNTLKASKGNQVKLQKIFGDEGMKGASEFVKRFNEAGQALGAGATEAQKLAAGEAAVRAAFTELSGAAGSWSEVVKDAATNTDTFEAKLTTAWEGVVAKVGAALTPGLSALIDNLDILVAPLQGLADEASDLMAAFGSMVEYLRRHEIIDAGEAPKQRTVQEKAHRLAEVDARLRELDKPDERLTSTQKAEKRRLKTEQADLRIETDLASTYDTLGAPGKPGGRVSPANSIYGNADPLGLSGGGGESIYKGVGETRGFDTWGEKSTMGKLWTALGPGVFQDAFKEQGFKMEQDNVASNAKGEAAAAKFDAAATKLAALPAQLEAALKAGGGQRAPTSLPGT